MIVFSLSAQSHTEKLTSLNKAEQEVSCGSLQLSQYWVRPGHKNFNTAAYITIRNPLLIQDKLLKAECEETSFTELHDHLQEEGVMKMRPVEAIFLTKEKIQLKPGSLHIMLMGLTKDLREGDFVKIHLVFEKSGSITLSFPIIKQSKS